MLLAMTAGQIGMFLLKMLLLLAGVFVIAVLTPKLAAFIDSKLGKKASPCEEEPSPERVDDETSTDIDDKKETDD